MFGAKVASLAAGPESNNKEPFFGPGSDTVWCELLKFSTLTTNRMHFKITNNFKNTWYKYVYYIYRL